MAKVITADQYKARHAKRGESKLIKVRSWGSFSKTPKRLGDGIKPEHAKRAGSRADMEGCFMAVRKVTQQ